MRKTCDRRRLPVGQLDPRPCAEIDLGLFARLALHPTKRQRAGPSQLGHEPPHAVVLVAEPFANQVLVDPLGREAQLQLLQDHLLDRARRHCDRPPSPRKWTPPKRRCPPPSQGTMEPDRLSQKYRPSRWALWLVLTAPTRWALWLVLNCRVVRPDKGDARLGSIFRSSAESPANDGLPGTPPPSSPVPTEPMGALAGFGSQVAARTYFATVSRSTSNSRAIARFRQPCSCKPRIA